MDALLKEIQEANMYSDEHMLSVKEDSLLKDFLDSLGNMILYTNLQEKGMVDMEADEFAKILTLAELRLKLK